MTKKKTKYFFQGDICFALVEDDVNVSGEVIPKQPQGQVIAEGEATGHFHVIPNDAGDVTLVKDTKTATDIPDNMYIGHLKVDSEQALLEHNEHDTIALQKGTYIVTGQREHDAVQVRRVAD